MTTLIKNEEGLSLVELLGTFTVLGLVMGVLTSVFVLIAQASTIQTRQVTYQQLANQLATQVEAITKIEGIYQQAGYLGKFDSLAFHEEHIVKTLDVTQTQVLSPTSQGESQLYVTDINDTLNERGQVYQSPNDQVKIKLIQQKNEHEVQDFLWWESYGMPNNRDTFSIQTKCWALFYEGIINFDEFYNPQNGQWEMARLLAEHPEQIHYKREFTVSYRDDEKAAGGVPGNGRW